MRDTGDFPQEPNDDDGVIIISADGGYWLLAGEDDLPAVLSGEPTYPTPVRMVAFADMIQLGAFLRAHDIRLVDLWSIHPAIIERLERADELVTLSSPDAA